MSMKVDHDGFGMGLGSMASVARACDRFLSERDPTALRLDSNYYRRSHRIIGQKDPPKRPLSESKPTEISEPVIRYNTPLHLAKPRGSKPKTRKAAIPTLSLSTKHINASSFNS
jgi:hypothetical protein